MPKPDNPRLALARDVLASAIGIHDLPDWHLIEQWIAAGYDLWVDILPTVRRVMKVRRGTEPGWQPKSLSCFTQMISRARVARVMGLTPTSAIPLHATNAREVVSAEELASNRKGRLGEIPNRQPEVGTKVTYSDGVAPKAHVSSSVMERVAADAQGCERHGGAMNKHACDCLWCGREFRPRTDGGKRQRFCGEACRIAFHRECRVWAIRAVDKGRLSLVGIRQASTATYTFLPEAKEPQGCPE